MKPAKLKHGLTVAAALGAAWLWGAAEFVALQWSRGTEALRRRQAADPHHS